MGESVSAACIKSLYKSLYKLRRALSLTYNAPLFVYYKNADLPTPGFANVKGRPGSIVFL